LLEAFFFAATKSFRLKIDFWALGYLLMDGVLKSGKIFFLKLRE
jgi:hypothetical protein